MLREKKRPDARYDFVKIYGVARDSADLLLYSISGSEPPPEPIAFEQWYSILVTSGITIIMLLSMTQLAGCPGHTYAICHSDKCMHMCACLHYDAHVVYAEQAGSPISCCQDCDG